MHKISSLLTRALAGPVAARIAGLPLLLLLLVGAAALAWQLLLPQSAGEQRPADATVRDIDPARGLYRTRTERDLEYPGGAGTPLAFDLHAPEDYKSTTYPILIWIHGGAWSVGDKAEPSSIMRAMPAARLGFVVLSINYRLHQPARPAPFPAATDDVAAFVAYLAGNLARFNANARTPISIGGFSAGGHLALFEATAAAAPLSFACVIDDAGVSDLTAQDFPAALVPYVQGFTGTPLLRAQASPARRLRQLRARAILVVHARDDGVVPFTQSTLLMQGLRSDAPRVSMSTYFPGTGGHGIFSPAANTVIGGFLATHCR